MRKKRTTININLEAKSQLDTSKWQGYVGIVPAVYRGFAFAIGAAQIFLFFPLPISR